MNTCIHTHNGIFHADEVVATAIIALMEDGNNVEVIRTRDEVTAPNALHFDVGGVYNPTEHKFDHHQRGFDVLYPDGIKYATAGLVWNEYGKVLITEIDDSVDDTMLVKIFDKVASTIKTIDAVDNGQTTMVGITEQVTLSQIISGYNPIGWDATDVQRDEAFDKAVEFATRWLYRLISMEIYRAQSEQEVLDACSEHFYGITLLNKGMPWVNAVISNWDQTKDCKVMVYPGTANDWRVQTFPGDKTNPQIMRCPAPVAGRGLHEAELAAITGVEDAIFIHAAGFIGGAKTKNGALLLATWWVNNTDK